MANEKLIDYREKLIEMLKKTPFKTVGEHADYLIANGVAITIRCKECLWFRHGFCYLNEETVMKDDADFCSCGEREEQ